jgi:hypothetical protein
VRGADRRAGGALTTADRTRAERAGSAGRSWGVALLTETEPGRRNRRTIDSVFFALAAVVIGLSALIASSAPKQDEDVAEALSTILGWADPFWRAVFIGVLVLAGVIVVDVLLRRRWDLARDLIIACLLVGGAAILLGRVVISDWFPLEAHVLSQWGYPELRLATGTAVIVVVGPELVRNIRVLAFWLVPLASLGAVVIGAALPSAILGALAAQSCAWCSERHRAFHLRRTSAALWRRSASTSPSFGRRHGSTAVRSSMWGTTPAVFR